MELTWSAAVSLSLRTTPSAVILRTWQMPRHWKEKIAVLFRVPWAINMISLDFWQFSFKLFIKSRIFSYMARSYGFQRTCRNSVVSLALARQTVCWKEHSKWVGCILKTPVAVRTKRLLSLPFGAMLSKKWKLTALIISLSLSSHSFIPCDETLESMRR